MEEERKVTPAMRLGTYPVCALILLLTVLFMLLPKEDFSQTENRKLARMPEFSVKSLTQGRFTEGLGRYAADHFPMREGFLGLMTEAERLTGRRLIEGVYLARDGYMIESYDGGEGATRQAGQFEKLSRNLENADCSLMLVPTAVTVYSDALPENAPEERYQQDVIDGIYANLEGSVNCLDVSSALRAGGDGLFYRTDHHWTCRGAYEGYRVWCEAKGLERQELSEFEENAVSMDFRGTVWSKLCDPAIPGEEMRAYMQPGQTLTVTYEDTGEVSDSLYNPEYLDKKDKYSYFLNNIHPLVTIENPDAPEGELAVVKDSYANSLIPFLTGHYRRIYVFDTRYYKGGPSKFINSHPEIKDVLLVYNMNTIDEDTGIGGIY